MIYEVKQQILCYAKYKPRETTEITKMHIPRSMLIPPHIALHLELPPKPVENELWVGIILHFLCKVDSHHIIR